MKTRILIICSILLPSLPQTTKAAHPPIQGPLRCHWGAPKEIKLSNNMFKAFKESSASTIALTPNDFEKEEETRLKELQSLLQRFHQKVVKKHTASTLSAVAQQAVILYLNVDKQETESNKPLTDCLQAKIAVIKEALPHDEQQ